MKCLRIILAFVSLTLLGETVFNFIQPTSPSATYPTHKAIYGKGGWMSGITNVSQLTNTTSGGIPVTRRESKMIVPIAGANWQLESDLVTWNLMPEETVRVEQFGAIGDGTGDDAAAINAAIVYANSKGLTTVASKTYRILSSVQMPSNTRLDGVGSGKIIRAFTNNADMWGAVQSYPSGFRLLLTNQSAPEVIVLATNLTLKNLTILSDWSVVPGQARLASFIGVQGMVMSGMHIGATNAGNSDDWLTDFWANDVQISDCTLFNGPGVFTDSLHLLGGRRYQIVNCSLTGGDDALAIIPSFNNSLSEVNVQNCYLRSFNGDCIRIGISVVNTNAVENIIVSGMTGEYGPRNRGIYIEDRPISGTNYTKLVRNITIRDCKFILNTNYNDFGAFNGGSFLINGGKDILLSGITITNAYDAARINYTTNLRLEKMKLRNTYPAIDVPGVVITGNLGYTDLIDLDLSHARGNALLNILSSEGVTVRGGYYANTGVTAGPAMRYITAVNAVTNLTGTFNGVESFVVSGALIEGNQVGIVFDQNPRSFLLNHSVFGTNLTTKVLYPAITNVPNFVNVVGNSGVGDYFKSGIATKIDATQVDFLTPSLGTIWSATRANGATMQFSLSGGFPTWTTLQTWHQFQAVTGIRGYNTTVETNNRAFHYAVQNYVTTGPEMGLRLRAEQTENFMQYGGGSGNLGAATIHQFFVGTNVTGTNVLTERSGTASLQITYAGGVAILTTNHGFLTARVTTPQLKYTETNATTGNIVADGEFLYETTIKRSATYNSGRSKMFYGTPSWPWLASPDTNTIAAGGILDSGSIQVPGALVGDLVIMSYPSFAGSIVLKGWVAGPSEVRIRAMNTGLTATNMSTNAIQFLLVPQLTLTTPYFVQPQGTYTATVTVSIGSFPNASIFYTLDGSTPVGVASGTEFAYTVPFARTTTTTVKAIAIFQGMTPSAVGTAVYTIL